MLSTIIEHNKQRRCLLCNLLVDELGNPDPKYYNQTFIDKLNSAPTEERCKHARVDKLVELIAAAKSLLEWVPVCSVGSSGYNRQEALKKAIARFE